ncbi:MULTISPECIES: GNAT family N-acetyltransferase [Oenococcus]|uniref:GNAT family acetyltransferase n=2 Tax=Lactobacillaceae TaxID=33958 RepID=G9WEX9_9LACO|nr:GNAT family N-acetyltransferase [Oenococcus kitaharae]EHN58539.1 GNAT family acetyltransferase [Oenococcus kitaharae DSM 17330]
MTEMNGTKIKLAVMPLSLAEEEYQIFKNPNLFVYTKHDYFKSVEEARDFIKKHNRLGNFWGIFLKDGQLIGNCQLSIHKITGELSYTIAEEYWGQGFASESVQMLIRLGFRNYSLSQIIGSCVADNIASAKVMLKNGMVFSKKEEKAFEKNGRFYDLLDFVKDSKK